MSKEASNEIVIASGNVHKIREFREMFKSTKNFELYSLLNFPNYTPPVENGTTFYENAVIKAKHAATTLNKWVIADDSGLVVPALQGAPGINSRYYAGKDASDADNRKKLLNEMSHLTEESRSAFFECCIVLCSQTGETKAFSGVCEGIVLTEEKGSQGFGYDSLFLKHGYDKSFAELGDAIKNRISHRQKAFCKLALALESLNLSI